MDIEVETLTKLLITLVAFAVQGISVTAPLLPAEFES